jgi:hypothetical protein
MANKIYLSDLMTNGGVVAAPVKGGEMHTQTANARIPSGTLLATTDKILVARYPTGTEFDRIHVRFPDLDEATSLTLNVGYDRPVTDPSKAYDATTNPYITGAIATADPDFFEASATTGQAGGLLNLIASGFTVTSSPESAGYVDVSITPAVTAGAATIADGTIEFLIDAFLTASNQVQGEFSGADALDYNTNYDI